MYAPVPISIYITKGIDRWILEEGAADVYTNIEVIYSYILYDKIR